jgi:hypothetical protein
MLTMPKTVSAIAESSVLLGCTLRTDKMPLPRGAREPFARRPGCMEEAHDSVNKRLTSARKRRRTATEAALRFYRNAASPTFEGDSVLVLHGLKAIGHTINDGYVGPFDLRQTRHTRIAALRAAKLFVPLIVHGDLPGGQSRTENRIAMLKIAQFQTRSLSKSN